MTRTLDDIRRLAQQAGFGSIHILSWRDYCHPEAGGSELHAHQIAKLWAASGINVTFRTCRSAGLPREEMRDGYRIIRRGNKLSVFFRAAFAEALGRGGKHGEVVDRRGDGQGDGRGDAVVEIWNGVPFGTPLWCRRPACVWIHYPHTELWHHTFAFKPLAALGKFLERRVFALPYRNVPVATLCESSATRLGKEFRLRNVSVAEPGVDSVFRRQEPNSGEGRAEVPLLVAVGRLRSYKRFDRLIRLVDRLRREGTGVCQNTELMIVGTGDQAELLKELIDSLQAQDWCRLAGSVGGDSLVALYQQAWLLVSASISEGWGMTITEAAACGTPSVVSNIDGHCDAVVADADVADADVDGGWLFEGDNDFVRLVAEVLNDDDARQRMGAAAQDRAATLTWENTAYMTLELLVLNF